jgi:hypothetical protein
MMLPEIPVGIDDPAERLVAVRDEMERLKSQDQANAFQELLRFAENLPAAYHALAGMGGVPQGALNLICTNVPGPMIPLYSVGHRMLAHYPMVPLAGDLGIGVGITSFDKGLYLGIMCDPAIVEDVGKIAEYAALEFRALRTAAGVEESDLPDISAAARGRNGANGAARRIGRRRPSSRLRGSESAPRRRPASYPQAGPHQQGRSNYLPRLRRGMRRQCEEAFDVVGHSRAHVRLACSLRQNRYEAAVGVGLSGVRATSRAQEAPRIPVVSSSAHSTPSGAAVMAMQRGDLERVRVATRSVRENRLWPCLGSRAAVQRANSAKRLGTDAGCHPEPDEILIDLTTAARTCRCSTRSMATTAATNFAVLEHSLGNERVESATAGVLYGRITARARRAFEAPCKRGGEQFRHHGRAGSPGLTT